jgi:hypothetical protein
MSNTEYEDGGAPADPRPIKINGKLFYSKTNTLCPTCSQYDRYLYVEHMYDGTVTQSCPYCDTRLYVKDVSRVLPSEE